VIVDNTHWTCPHCFFQAEWGSAGVVAHECEAIKKIIARSGKRRPTQTLDTVIETLKRKEKKRG
jgi:hypothetical protein